MEDILKEILEEQYMRNMLMDHKYFSLNDKGLRADSIFDKNSVENKLEFIAKSRSKRCC